MKVLKLIAYCILFSNAIWSQERILNGQIIADSIASREVNVVNLNSKQGTVNLKNGNFQISAKAGDTIFFSSLQYEPHQITVVAEDFTEVKNVYLHPLINELEGVNLSNVDLTGFLNKDVEVIENQGYYNASSLGFPVIKNRSTLAERRLYTAGNQLIWSKPTTVPNLTISVDRVMNEISGKMAMLRRQRINEIEKMSLEKAYSIFNNKFYTDELGISENLIEDFLYFCVTFKSFSRLIEEEKKTLDLIEFLIEKSTAYKVFKELDNEQN